MAILSQPSPNGGGLGGVSTPVGSGGGDKVIDFVPFLETVALDVGNTSTFQPLIWEYTFAEAGDYIITVFCLAVCIADAANTEGGVGGVFIALFDGNDVQIPYSLELPQVGYLKHAENEYGSVTYDVPFTAEAGETVTVKALLDGTTPMSTCVIGGGTGSAYGQSRLTITKRA